MDEKKVSTVAKAMRILNSFGINEPELGVMELSRRLEINKSTISRILATLEAGALVERVESSGKYRLGIGVLLLASKTYAYMDLRKVASDLIHSLSEKSRETVSLSMLRGEHVVALEVALSPFSLRNVSWIGKHNPLHCTSSGKLLLAYSPEEFINLVLSRSLVRYTANTILDSDELRAELAKIRKNSIAIAKEEYEPGLNAFSLPVFSRDSEVICAISVSGPCSRLTRAKIQELVPLARTTTRDISARLGYMSNTYGG